jgi:hypothetical protein
MNASLSSAGLAFFYRVWKYGRLGLAVLAFLLVAIALGIGPVRTADFIVKCGESFQHLWKR